MLSMKITSIVRYEGILVNYNTFLMLHDHNHNHIHTQPLYQQSQSATGLHSPVANMLHASWEIHDWVLQ